MADQIQLTAADGHQLDAYINPAPNAKAAVVILQEIFGVNHHIRSVVDQFAGDGFWSMAPALFDRARRGVELNYDNEGMEAGKKIAFALKPEEVLLDIDAAIQFARAQVPGGKVGVAGYCFGGSYAWLSATRLQPDAAVVYYGSMVGKFATETPHCPVQMHFGEKDHGIPASEIDKVRQAHLVIPIYMYDAGHGFCCRERASYAPEACAHAYARTRQFLAGHLGLAV
jgi:carboxymethylenebutenolidase